MDEVVNTKRFWTAASASIRTGLQPIWDVDFVLGVARSVYIPAIIILLAILYHALCRAFQRLRKMQEDNTKPFPFESLPQELRDMVYINLLEDVSYPPPAANQPSSSLNGMLSGLWGAATNTRSTRASKPCNWIFLANKQIYSEYMDVHCKQSTFHLTVSPENYQPTGKDTRIWSLAPSTLKMVRKAHLEIITTSAMLGCTDPRNMESSSWTLAERVRAELSRLESCTHLTLSAKAIGDPLWNPLWIWFHSSQSFKTIGTELSDHPTGPTLDKVTFSLDTWSPGENYLERDSGNKGAWTWYCMKGHGVGLDGGSEQTVREFCGMLYRECRICRPVEEGDDEDE